MKCVLSAAVGAACLLSFTSLATAQQPSGKTVGVSPAAYANGQVGYRVLALEQGIYMGDRVETGAAGEAQLLFNDNTRLVVGPSSSLQIDSYVVREDNKLRSFALTALRGAYRFSTGNGPKQAYNIRTPAMTLGIRGTKFDFSVAYDGSTDFVLLEGSARVCDRAGNCIVASDPCTFISVPTYAPMRRVTGFERSVRLRESFPYVVSQRARLRQDFQFNVSSCGQIFQTQNPDARRSDQTVSGFSGPSAAGPGPTPNQPTPNQPTPNQPTPNQPTPNEPSGPTPNQPTPNEPTPNQPTPNDPTPSDPGKGHGNNGKGNGGGDKSPTGKDDSDR
jgi:hypothetical protein